VDETPAPISDPAADRFVRELVAAVPRLRGLLNEHVHDQGELLPHVFFGDVARALATTPESRSVPRSELEDALAFMERGLHDGEPSVQELIVASFLENVPPRELRTDIRPMLGPALRAAYERLY
jgi:hypothetical protein